MPYNFAAESFTQRNFVADFLQQKSNFLRGKRKKIVAFEGLRATYTVHLRLIEKLVGNLLLVIMELFSLGAFVFSQYTCDRWTDRRTDGITIMKTTLAYNAAR